MIPMPVSYTHLSVKEFGKVMGVIMPKVKGKADGNQVNAIVKELLQS